MSALRWCDACVMVMPCGMSASLEAVFAVGAGKPVFVHVPAMREPDLMVRMADVVTDELARIWTKIEAIRAKQAAKPTNSPLPLSRGGGVRRAEKEPASRGAPADWISCGLPCSSQIARRKCNRCRRYDPRNWSGKWSTTRPRSQYK
jgi:hypothetical protein